MTITIAMLVDYVMINRRGKAFQDWTPIQLADAFVQAAEDKLLLFATDGDEIVGVVHGGRCGYYIHVCNILTTRRGILRDFIQRFTELYPNLTLSAQRHERFREYNTTKLVNKILRKN